MADRSVYLNNEDDQISAQKRLEQRGAGIVEAGLTAGAVATFILARRKVNLARAFSAEVKSVEGALGVQYNRYLITEIAGKSDASITRFRAWSKNVHEAIKAPIPTAAEQLEVAVERINQNLEMTSRRMGLENPIRFSSASIPQEIIGRSDKWGKLQTYLHGPIGAVAPGTPIILPGSMAERRLSTGRYGGLAIAGDLLRLGKEGEVASIIPGVHVGLGGTAGARTEFLRASFRVKEFQNLRAFTENVVAPMKSDILLEHRRKFLESWLSGKSVSPAVKRTEKTTRDVVETLSKQADVHASSIGEMNPLSSKEARESIDRSQKEALDKIIEEQMKKASTQRAYNVYKFQMGLGAGEPFASYEHGEIQRLVRRSKESLGMQTLDPFTGRPYPVRGPRYIPEGKSITGFWESGAKGTYYVYPSSATAKRYALDFFEGTFIRQLEQFSGFGMSSGQTKVSDFVSSMVGAQKGSYGEFAIRRYSGIFGRLAVLGGGGYTAYKLVNYIAHQTVGWGIDDTAGKMYTTSREFQQHVIDQLGIVDTSKKLEHAFPGIIKSPLAMIARATAPYWMMRQGGKMFGKFGAQVGLALGTALALVTWGDITQSPEELHRIYTGEQDIPVRKGRWWMFGKTPFGGGKVMYWRPHWYPLMRSRYQYRGQLWDSETEEIANTGPLAPILSPLLTGKVWDPYRWEKKHYHDRPYPLTGELFEPTMPFAWLGNMTIGNLIKPQTVMHPEYWGQPQAEGGTPRTYVPGVAGQLGLSDFTPNGMLPNDLPSSVGWNLSMGLYTQAEQMGIRGFLVNKMVEDITGRPDFLPTGPVAQSASRATGYERAYWDLNIGDPANFTEFFRRILPHRRRAIEEYNPIPNTMPDWIPGEDYFINFRAGDPYTKVEMGEARLPGAGYESLHHLHSGIPHVYDAVDRFLILSDIAPYSKEYSHYRILAMGMTKKDPYWSEVFKRHIEQRAKTQEEYEFLDLEPPEDVTGLTRPLSSAYRRGLSFITGPGSILEPAVSAMMNYKATGSVSPFFMAQFPISKYLPYKTASQTYKDYRLYGSEFTDWGNPISDFLYPYMNQVAGTVAGLTGQTYIPPGEEKRREYDEYFDRLQYVKYRKLARMAMDKGNSELASKFNTLSQKTMAGVNPYINENRMIVSLPKRERAFFGSFINAPEDKRDEIAEMVSPDMARIYRAQWAMRDGGGRGRANVGPDVEGFFDDHYIPPQNWPGWHPDVDLKDVQMKVVRNEGMNIHSFDLWESQERAMARRPYVPSISDIHARGDDIENLKRLLHAQLSNDGYNNHRTFVTRTPATQNSVNLRIKVKRDRSKERDQYMRSTVDA